MARMCSFPGPPKEKREREGGNGWVRKDIKFYYGYFMLVCILFAFPHPLLPQWIIILRLNKFRRDLSCHYGVELLSNIINCRLLSYL